MQSKVHIPSNNLGSFLTSKNISNIDIYAKTGIPTAELSQLRKGTVKGIEARKLFLIALVGKISIKEMLEGVYPVLKLQPALIKLSKTDFNDMSDFFKFIENDIIQIISDKTGITPYRLKRIKHNKVKPGAHELYSIELATKTKSGTLFNTLYKNLKLNPPEKETELREEEKLRSRKNLKN